MLEVGELGAGFGAAGFAGIEDFGAEFGAGGAEEVGFLCFVVSACAFLYGRTGTVGNEGWRAYVFYVGFGD